MFLGMRRLNRVVSPFQREPMMAAALFCRKSGKLAGIVEVVRVGMVPAKPVML